jgi:hypothetical protein
MRIPLPGLAGEDFVKGVDSGSQMFARLMQPIIEREKQKQLEEHFKQQMQLQRASAGRAAALFPLRMQELKDKMQAAEFDRNMMNQLMGGAGASQSNTQQMPIPKDVAGEGMGMFSPQGLDEAQTQAAAQESAQPKTGFNLEVLKQNPILRGWFKHRYGSDPLAPIPQTPEEKQAGQLDLFRQKENIRAANKSGDIATNKVLTQNQQAIQAIDTVVPMLDEFINDPRKIYGATDFSRGKKAAYQAKTGGMIDMLVAAQNLPQVKESVDLVEQQIRRATGESTKDYVERLKDLKKDLMARRTKSKSIVSSKRVTTDDYSNMSDDELRKIVGGG